MSVESTERFFGYMFLPYLIDMFLPSITFSKVKNLDYLPPLNIELFFITSTDILEVHSIISSLNLNKVMDKQYPN